MPYKNRERQLEYFQNYNHSIKRKSFWKKLREDMIAAYGAKCACCGESIYEFLQLDHINGGGNKHRRNRSPWSILMEIRRLGFPKDEYQLLCANCNLAKGFYGACPHNFKPIIFNDGAPSIANYALLIAEPIATL